MSQQLLDRILEAAQAGETTDWELKSARGGFPGSLWETYSAMANSEGGIVVLGVSEADGTARLDGLTHEQVSRYQKTLWDGLNNRGQVSLNLLEPQHVETRELEGALLLLIQIPRATRTQRPVYVGGNPFGHTFRRRHEGDYRCTDAEVRRMLADADPVPADARILSGFALGDLDRASLTQYRQRFRSAKGDHPWLALDDKELLERLGGWRRDRASGEDGLTIAGLLMFGQDQAIRDPEAAPEYFVDYREKLDPTTRWSDRIYPDGTWEANLFQFYSRVWPRLAAALPKPFQLEGGVRKDETPAHEALREAFVNAMIHADYAAPGGVVVERHPDRLALENPGILLVSLEQYRRGGVSECRNKALQTMFLMIGGGERAGSGADKIRSGWRAQQWRAPEISVQGQPDRVRLTLPMVSLIPEATLDRLRRRFGEIADALSPADIQALATAEIEGAVTNSRLQELMVDHPVDITRMLQRLCDRGLLVSDNRRRWTTYRLGGTEVPPPLLNLGDSTHLGGDSTHLAWDSTHLAGDLAGDSTHLAGDSTHLARRPPEEDEELRAIAEPVARRGKVPTETLRRIIHQLCSSRYLTAEELARLLNRSAANLRLRHLTPMVNAGRLRLRFPGAFNRPDQAYTSVNEPAEPG